MLVVFVLSPKPVFLGGRVLMDGEAPTIVKFETSADPIVVDLDPADVLLIDFIGIPR